MATLDSLKWNLKQKAMAMASSSTRPLSEIEYDAGFSILARGSEETTYQEFIIPQLSLLLAPLLDSRIGVSVLEVGPGPESVLGCLPEYLRQKVQAYTAFEPNKLFATRLEKWLCSASETRAPLPYLRNPPVIFRIPFTLDSNVKISTSVGTSHSVKNYDVILFCHSMYGMKPQNKFIERALDLLPERPEGGMVVVFHRDRRLHLGGLACHRTSFYPTGSVRVTDDDKVLDSFAPFVAGYTIQDFDARNAVQLEWRKVCRSLGCRGEANPNHLLFSSPSIMMAFTRQATALRELTVQVPVVRGDISIKNREARLHHPASILRPNDVQQVQECVRWALDHKTSLAIIGGGHSGHCIWPNVVSVDMSAFNGIHILTAGEEGGMPGSYAGTLVVAEAGCKSGDIVRKTMAAGVTVPLGARPSVGAGLWLQGGIGHLARLHGLACDAIVGAVVVSVASGQVLCIGNVPSQHRPIGAVQPTYDMDMSWVIKGAGTNFGVVISVTFKTYAAPTYTVRNWIVPLSDNIEVRLKLSRFDELIARQLPRHCSADAYLYWDTKLCLGVSMFESSTIELLPEALTLGTAVLGLEENFKTVDGIGLFESEMYMSGMHGGHGGGKTSSFKRCLFLKRIGAADVANALVAAIEARPSSLCYLHLLQGGGAVGDVAKSSTAFGCRDWDFACVVTGVWLREQDGTEAARTAVQWVYSVAEHLLPLSNGAYGADLGPDPRDTALAANAFGPNLWRLASLKNTLDPSNVLAYACPLPKEPIGQKLIVLVTGQSCAGKDYCADMWVSAISMCSSKNLRARKISISDATKREYAMAAGADLERLLRDRAYKEQHRPALSSYFQAQVQQQPQLPKNHFLNLLHDAVGVDVLFITGMRDVAPVAALSHLVPDSRLVEVRVQASREMRRARGGHHSGDDDDDDDDDDNDDSQKDKKSCKDSNTRPDFIFRNDATGNEAVEAFPEQYLLRFLGDDLRRLSDMVHLVHNFPHPGIEFRDVLAISQQQGGLVLCTSLLQTHFTGDWANVNALVCCETGGFVFASALAARVNLPMALIREAGKLPPPTISVIKLPSHISSSASDDSSEKRMEMGRDVVASGASVVVVDDVLATGKTLCAVFQLLDQAGIGADDVSVMVVAEFPIHRGRELLRQRGFGGAKIQSLLVFGGA